MEVPEFLAPGLCLLGDNAYVNSRYMATPFTMQSSGDKYNYNYFHSSLRIKIECAFGMLVARWGVLRSAISAKIGLKKTPAMVICLCKLHNYCIDSRIKRAQEAEESLQQVVASGKQRPTPKGWTPKQYKK